MTDFNYSDKTKELFGNPEAFMKTPDFDKMIMGDMFGYDSPIQTIASQIEMSFDEQVYKAVQRVGIEVDKNELIKALRYDRQQYAKGFRTGCEKGLQVSQNEIDKFIGYLGEDMIARIKIAIEKRQGNLIP